MKSSLLTAIILVSLALTTGAEERLEPGWIIPWADPTIIVENGRYYLTGTNNSNTGGFQILESTDLISWNYVENGANSFIIRKGPDTFGNHSFWAPQILRHNGRYLLTYSAEARMCIAESNQPYGPYRQRECRPISDTTQMNIDTFLLPDDDGRWYMFHARFEQQGEVGGNTIQVAEFDFDKQRLVDSTLTLCLKVAEPWEYTDDGRDKARRHLLPVLLGQRLSEHRLFGGSSHCHITLRPMDSPGNKSDYPPLDSGREWSRPRRFLHRPRRTPLLRVSRSPQRRGGTSSRSTHSAPLNHQK